MHRLTAAGWRLQSDRGDYGAMAIEEAQVAHRRRVAEAKAHVNSFDPPASVVPHNDRRKKLLAAQRAAEIEHENLLLVARFRNIIGRKQLDNIAPVSTMPRSLNRRQRTIDLTSIALDNERMAERIIQARGQVPKREECIRANEAYQAVIARHCHHPFKDPLTFRHEYYVDPDNPYCNWSGGQKRIVRRRGANGERTMRTEGDADEKSPIVDGWMSISPSSSNGSRSPRKTSRPNSSHSHSHSHSRSVSTTSSSTHTTRSPSRPSTARSTTAASHHHHHQRLHSHPLSLIAQDPILLTHRRHDRQTRFTPLRQSMQKNGTSPSSIPHLSASALSSTAASIAASAASTSLSPDSILLHSSPATISGLAVLVHVFECSSPWSLCFVVLDESSGVEYRMDLTFQHHIEPIFRARPDMLQPTDAKRSAIIETIIKALRFVESDKNNHSTRSSDRDPDSTNETGPATPPLSLYLDLPPLLPRSPNGKSASEEQHAQSGVQAKDDGIFTPRTRTIIRPITPSNTTALVMQPSPPFAPPTSTIVLRPRRGLSLRFSAPQAASLAAESTRPLSPELAAAIAVPLSPSDDETDETAAGRSENGKVATSNTPKRQRSAIKIKKKSGQRPSPSPRGSPPASNATRSPQSVNLDADDVFDAATAEMLTTRIDELAEEQAAVFEGSSRPSSSLQHFRHRRLNRPYTAEEITHRLRNGQLRASPHQQEDELDELDDVHFDS